MRFKKAEHCDGSGCVLSWIGWVFCCLHLHGITKYVVVKGRCWKIREEKSLLQVSVVVFTVFMLGAWLAWLVFCFLVFFLMRRAVFSSD